MDADKKLAQAAASRHRARISSELELPTMLMSDWRCLAMDRAPGGGAQHQELAEHGVLIWN
jgi:hypothetical protein